MFHDTDDQTAHQAEVHEPIDVEGLLRRCMGNSQLATRMLIQFAAKIQEDMAWLAAVVDVSIDPAEVIGITHTLQGSAGAIGAIQVQAAAQAVEQSLHRTDLGAAARHLELLRSELAACHDHIPHAKHKLAGPWATM